VGEGKGIFKYIVHFLPRTLVSRGTGMGGVRWGGVGEVRGRAQPCAPARATPARARPTKRL